MQAICKKDTKKSPLQKLVNPKTTYESESTITMAKYKSMVVDDGVSIMSANPIALNQQSSKNTYQTANNWDYS